MARSKDENAATSGHLTADIPLEIRLAARHAKATAQQTIDTKAFDELGDRLAKVQQQGDSAMEALKKKMELLQQGREACENAERVAKAKSQKTAAVRSTTAKRPAKKVVKDAPATKEEVRTSTKEEDSPQQDSDGNKGGAEDTLKEKKEEAPPQRAYNASLHGKYEATASQNMRGSQRKYFGAPVHWGRYLRSSDGCSGPAS